VRLHKPVVVQGEIYAAADAPFFVAGALAVANQIYECLVSIFVQKLSLPPRRRADKKTMRRVCRKTFFYYTSNTGEENRAARRAKKFRRENPQKFF